MAIRKIPKRRQRAPRTSHEINLVRNMMRNKHMSASRAAKEIMARHPESGSLNLALLERIANRKRRV